MTSPSRPLNHYQLLGLREFESDPGKITAAAETSLVRLRTVQPGERRDEWERILDELSVAKLVLSDSARRGQYDGQLRAHKSPRPSSGPANAGSKGPQPATSSGRISPNAADDLSAGAATRCHASQCSAAAGESFDQRAAERGSADAGIIAGTTPMGSAPRGRRFSAGRAILSAAASRCAVVVSPQLSIVVSACADVLSPRLSTAAADRSASAGVCAAAELFAARLCAARWLSGCRLDSARPGLCGAPINIAGLFDAAVRWSGICIWRVCNPATHAAAGGAAISSSGCWGLCAGQPWLCSPELCRAAAGHDRDTGCRSDAGAGRGS